MLVKLAKPFLIICSVSLLTLLPACGGQQSWWIVQEGILDSAEGESNGSVGTISLQDDLNFSDFETKINASLETLKADQNINYDNFNTALASLNQFNTSIDNFQSSIDKQLKNQKELKQVVDNSFTTIETSSGEIKSILENFNADGTKEDKQKIQRQIGLTGDNVDGDIIPGETSSSIISKYLTQRTERIKDLVQFINAINLLANNTDSKPNPSAINSELSSSLDNLTHVISLISILLIILIILVFIITVQQEIRKRKEKNRRVNPDRVNENGERNLQNELVEVIKKLLSSHPDSDNSQLEEFLNSLPKILVTLQNLEKNTEFMPQLEESIKSLQKLEKLGNLDNLASISEIDNSQLVKFLSSLSTIKEPLQNLEKLENFDNLAQLINLVKLSENQLSTLKEFVQSFKDSQHNSNYLEVFSEIDTALKLLPKIAENLERINSTKSTPVKSSSPTEQQPKIGRGTSEVFPNLTNSTPRTMFSQSFPERKTEDKTPEPTVESEYAPVSSDYDSPPFPQLLINCYHNDPNDFKKRSSQVKQSEAQIQQQLGGNLKLIFELAIEGDTPYWILPCDERNPYSTGEELYWLFLAPNQQITEHNYSILYRLFQGKIDRLWVGKKWQLVKPALLKKIHGTNQFQLANQGRLKLNV